MSELLFKPVEKGPRRINIGSAVRNPFAGRTTLGSGVAAVTVSTTMIKSGSMMSMATFPASVVVAANSGGRIVVNSVVHEKSFCFSRATGVGVPWDEVISWEITQTQWK